MILSIQYNEKVLVLWCVLMERGMINLVCCKYREVSNLQYPFPGYPFTTRSMLCCTWLCVHLHISMLWKGTVVMNKSQNNGGCVSRLAWLIDLCLPENVPAAQLAFMGERLSPLVYHVKKSLSERYNVADLFSFPPLLFACIQFCTSVLCWEFSIIYASCSSHPPGLV